MVVVKHRNIKVLDLFAGIGGLTYGLQSAGLKVVAGIDSDASCQYGYESSNQTRLIVKDIMSVNPTEIDKLFGRGGVRVLAGCAPCQPYSLLNKKRPTLSQANTPLDKFLQFISTNEPHIVSMENVPGLLNADRYPVFGAIVETLKRRGYSADYRVVNAVDYGVPQNRRRLVLLASRLGAIEIPKSNAPKRLTLRDAIGALPPIDDGVADLDDRLHYARKLGDLNKARIRSTRKDGGTYRDWPRHLLLDCHKKDSGKSFKYVYGRMRWDSPSPTITTYCVGIGNGRFGHPDQDRGLSLREAARIQTFPDSYIFMNPQEGLKINRVARFIGNAVPIKLAEAIGNAITTHVTRFNERGSP